MDNEVDQGTAKQKVPVVDRCGTFPPMIPPSAPTILWIDKSLADDKALSGHFFRFGKA
jgi:hypothetical protein